MDDSGGHVKMLVDGVFAVVLALSVLCVIVSEERQADVFFSLCVLWAIAAGGGSMWIAKQKVAKRATAAAAALPPPPPPSASAARSLAAPEKKKKKGGDAAKVVFDDAKVKKVCLLPLSPNTHTHTHTHPAEPGARARRVAEEAREDCGRPG